MLTMRFQIDEIQATTAVFQTILAHRTQQEEQAHYTPIELFPKMIAEN